MHVIVGAANLDRNSAGADDDSAEVLPKSRANVIRDLRYPVLGAVDQVVVKARERLGHVTPWRGVVPGVSPSLFYTSARWTWQIVGDGRLFAVVEALC